MRPLETLITADRLGDEGAVEHDAPVIDLLVKRVVAPLRFRDRELGELLLDGHFRFHIPEVVGFEQRPLVRCVCRIVPDKAAVPCLGRSAEVPDEIFAFFELLLFQPQHSTDAFQ